MLLRLIPAFLLLFAAPAWLPAGDGKAKHRISFHAEGRAEDGEGKVFPHRVLDEQKWFNLSPEMTHLDFTAFTGFRSDDGVTWGASFFLDARGSAKLLQLTTSRPGSYLLVAIDGQPVDYMLIDRPVHHGILTVWRGLGDHHLAFLEQDLGLPVARTPEDVPPANRMQRR